MGTLGVTHTCTHNACRTLGTRGERNPFTPRVMCKGGIQASQHTLTATLAASSLPSVSLALVAADKGMAYVGAR
jgi:hypothetical protein